jgi:cytoskeletal protein CcmA (bactofilin family)
MSSECLDIFSASYANVPVTEARPRPLLFDTQVPFEQWLQALSAPASHGFETQSSERLETIQVESRPGDCEVIFDGELHVNGQLTGNIRSAHGTLVMSKHGHVNADVDVRVALIDGHLEGTLRATEHVVLDRNARVAGNIHTPSLTIKDGAVFDGTSFMLERSIYAEICEPGSRPTVLQTKSAGA